MDTLELIKRAQSGNRDAREQVIMENVGLVWSVVRRFLGRGYEAEDLFQIGSIGLMKAIDKFDLGYDVRFSTYAVPMISGEIRRFLRDDGMVKVSRSMKENGSRLSAARERLGQELGREATLRELARETGLSMEDVVLAIEACAQVESLESPIYQNDGTAVTLEEKLPEKEDMTERLLNHMLLEQLLDSLNETERQLITMRYYDGCTQMEVAGQMGISQVQVSRLEKKILARLRENLIGNPHMPAGVLARRI